MRIPVYQPNFDGREREYLLDAFDSGWISSRGAYIDRFEAAFAKFVGAESAVSVANGTVALHLVMLGAGIGPGDEVIVPTFTYVASVNAMAFVGAVPVFVECTPDTWQIDIAAVKARITKKTRAIMAVHLYGHPSNMTALREIADEHGLILIEDAAEAFGATWQGVHVGTVADFATFSFFGNKTITTGEGGMVLARDRAALEEMRKLKSQYVSPTRRYWHDKVGYNFRMTNLQAAIGLAQIERADAIIARKREIAELYRAAFSGSPVEVHGEAQGAVHSYWMVSALLPNADARDPLMAHLEQKGIETRPLFYPVHTMPMFSHFATSADAYPVSENISARGLNLPSWPGLRDEDVRDVANEVLEFLTRHAKVA